MTATLTTNPDACLAEIRVDGRVTREDFDALAPAFEAFVDACGTIRLIEIIESLDGFDSGLIWQGLKLDLRVLPHISHCAVVGDIGWLSPLSKAAGALVSTRLRTFARAEEADARRWLAEDG